LTIEEEILITKAYLAYYYDSYIGIDLPDVELKKDKEETKYKNLDIAILFSSPPVKKEEEVPWYEEIKNENKK
tara:strand:+ start:109 stop:327 length:219 start_codon:yes stop_codon:yes gene_type:complete